MKYYLKVLKNYTNLSGRARRSEYWYFTLFNFIILIMIGASEAVAETFILNATSRNVSIATPFGILYLVYVLFTIIPSFTVLVRRLHDINKTGWYFLVSFIPVVGFLWLLILLLTDSTFGPNRYGPNPKGIGNTDEIDQIGSHLVF